MSFPAALCEVDVPLSVSVVCLLVFPHCLIFFESNDIMVACVASCRSWLYMPPTVPPDLLAGHASTELVSSDNLRKRLYDASGGYFARGE